MGQKINFPKTENRPDASDSPLLEEDLLLKDLSAPQGGENRKTLLQKVSRPPGFTLNSLLVAAVGVTVLALMGFVDVTLPSPLSLQALEEETWRPVTYYWMQYGFQIPVALFLGAFLGPVVGAMALLAYLAMGLSGLPLFSGGGGWTYFYQPGFGYLVGMSAGAILAGKYLAGAFQTSHLLIRRSFKLFGVALFSVLAVHLCGLTGIAVQWAVGLMSLDAALNWMLRLSVEPMPYDFLMSAILFCVVRQLRLCLWLVLY